MDFSGEDRASGMKFCMVVHRSPGQGMSHFGELCSHRSSPRSLKSDESASLYIICICICRCAVRVGARSYAWPVRMPMLATCTTGMCG